MVNNTQVKGEAPVSVMPSLLITLTQDEVALLLRMMKADGTPSFRIPTGFDESAASAASRSLRARGIAHLTPDGQFQVNDGLMAVIGTGLSFAQLLAVSHQADDGSTHNSWFYIAPGLTVQHRVAEPGIHTFQTIPDGMTMLLALAAAMELRPDKAEIEPTQVTLPTEVWEMAREQLSAGNTQGAGAVLAEQGVSEAFARAVAEAPRRSVVSLVGGLPNKTLRASGLYVLDVGDGYWLAQPTVDGSQLTATATNGPKVLDCISDMLLALSAAQHG